jgi:[protein-PII] uridylyltransferase
MAPTLDRATVFGDPTLAGVALCRAYSDLVDVWLRELFEIETGQTEGVALVAVGGYGREELSPQSDIDLLLLHDGRPDIAEIAERVWYPIWDEGLKLGHSVRTVKEALALAADDLDTATSLLSSRHVAGSETLVAELVTKARALWQKRAKRWLAELSRSVRARHPQFGEVAFLLEPDLKDGRGGLRDVHAVRWAEAARTVMLEGDDANLAEAYAMLLGARVELHRRTGRPGDRLVLEEQTAVAEALGYDDADELMRDISAAARRISWTSDEVWIRVDSSLAGPFQRRISRDRDLGSGIVLREGVVELRADNELVSDPLTPLRVAAAAAGHDTRIERRTLDRMARSTPSMPTPWSAEARQLLVDLLLCGETALPVIEALDQRGLWLGLLPEWEAVRFKPQRNAYHTFTVDRHLWQASANAAALADRVDRPDLLVLGALFHDIGKGHPGDHTDVGIALMDEIGPRLGLSDEDIAVLKLMIRHHLLLPDVAVRRDLSDDGTIEWVAKSVGSLENLELLAALTEADSLATGPAAWGEWKAGLVRDLVNRTAHVLSGGVVAEVVSEKFPTDEQVARMKAGARAIEANDDRLTVISPDRPGLFWRVAAALSLNGLDVMEAAAYSDEDGMALETFRVESSFGPIIAWDRVVDDVEKALDSRIALHSRLAERARVYSRRTFSPHPVSPPSVLIDNEISRQATVVEVRAPDAIGVLYKVTHALAELDLDLRSAKVQTMGAEVIDSFYVRNRGGHKIAEPAALQELERAILHALSP